MSVLKQQKQAFHFVLANPASEQDRKRESQLARSHTARINRINRLPVRPSDGIQVPKKPAQRLPDRAPSFSRRCDDRRVMKQNRVEKDSRDLRNITSSQELQRRTTDQLAPSEHVNLDSNAHASTEAVPAVLRTVSPVLGAPHSTTFSLGSSSSQTARAADYCEAKTISFEDAVLTPSNAGLNVIWPNLLMDRNAATSWFALFGSEPILWHGFHYALTTHHDLLCNQISWSSSRASLMHKTKAITLLNGMLSTLTDDNIELAILAVLVLATNELRPEDIVDHSKGPFDPPMPAANWVSLYGRMNQVPEHGRAMVTLIMRRGGLKHIRTPGLARVLALTDLLAASKVLAKPIFSCCSHDDLGELLRTQSLALDSNTIEAHCGRGFHKRVPSCLPDHAMIVFRNLSIVDYAMDQYRTLRPQGQDLKKVIVGAGNCVHHHLLSLPPWEELTGVEQGASDISLYECCRLSATLYAISVTFPVPTLQGRSELLQRLVAHLTPSVLLQWTRYGTPFLLWVLVIGGIASFSTPHRLFFQRTMKNVLSASNHYLPKATVRAALEDFLWKESACGRGFNEFWSGLGLDKTSDLDD